MLSKSALAIVLSKLNVFESPKHRDEQYATDAETAAVILWAAFMNGHIKDKTVADFGAGTGILGIGALLMGAKHVYFIEKDEDAIRILEKNLEFDNCSIVHQNIEDYTDRIDTVIQNPPFGTVKKHADRNFLHHSFKAADVVYSIHKTTTREYLHKYALKHGFGMTVLSQEKLPLKKSYLHHSKHISRIDVDLLKFQIM